MLAYLNAQSHARHGGGMLRRLAKPAALALALAAVGSMANAADCVNGYRTLPNQVILLCDSLGDLSDRRALMSEGSASAVTSGISEPDVRPSRAVVADDIGECRPGMYRMMYWENGSMMLPCK